MLESLIYGFLIGIPVWFIVLSTKKESEEEKIKAEKYQTYLLTILLINSILIILLLIFKKIYDDLLYYFYTRSTLVIDLVCIINIIVKIINKIKNKILLSKNFYLYILNLISNFVRCIVYHKTAVQIHFKDGSFFYKDGISFIMLLFIIIFVDIIMLITLSIIEKVIKIKSQ